MADPAWSFGLGALALVVVVLLGRRASRHNQRDDDAWASVRLSHRRQADGCFPIGVVRVHNPALLPVVVSASVRARWTLRWWRHSLWACRPLSVRSARVGRRPRPPEEMLLGAVSGGGVGLWELPLATSGRPPVVKVRLDQAGPRARVFNWALCGPLACDTRPAEPRRPALIE